MCGMPPVPYGLPNGGHRPGQAYTKNRLKSVVDFKQALEGFKVLPVIADCIVSAHLEAFCHNHLRCSHTETLSKLFKTWLQGSYKNTFQMKKSMFNWNFGIGAMLTKKVEVGVVYSLGIAKTGELQAELDKAKENNNELKPKSKTVQISATLFF